MSIFLIIYILGIIATLYLFYHKLDKGDAVNIVDLILLVMMSSCSWVTFFILLINIYGDKIVFTKK